jgi:predicted nucleic acid-binding protein
VTASVDSVIVIDYLNGVPGAAESLGDGVDIYISIVAWIEVLAGTMSDGQMRLARGVLDRLRVIDVTPPIAEEAVRIRRERRMKLPDAIILATARHLGVPLLTRNTKDFDASDPMVRVPYTV